MRLKQVQVSNVNHQVISNTDELNEDKNLTLPSSEMMEIMNPIDMIESRCINSVVVGWGEART